MYDTECQMFDGKRSLIDAAVVTGKLMLRCLLKDEYEARGLKEVTLRRYKPQLQQLTRQEHWPKAQTSNHDRQQFEGSATHWYVTSSKLGKSPSVNKSPVASSKARGIVLYPQSPAFCA